MRSLDLFPGLSKHPVLLIAAGGAAFVLILFMLMSDLYGRLDPGSWRHTLLYASGIAILVNCASGARAAYGSFAAYMYSGAVAVVLYATARIYLAITPHHKAA